MISYLICILTRRRGAKHGTHTMGDGLHSQEARRFFHIGFPPFSGVCRMAVSTASTYFGDARRGTARLAALAAPTMQRTAEPTSALTARLPWPCSR